MKPVVIIVIAVVSSVVAVLGILEGIVYYNQYAYEEANLGIQLDRLIAKVGNCGSMTEMSTIEQKEKIWKCKKDVREDVRTLLEKFGIYDQTVRQEFLNNHPEFFPKFPRPK